jgi:hypothetical protein
MTISAGDMQSVGTLGFWTSGTTPGVAPEAPTLSVGLTTTVATATIAGTAGATHELYYRVTDGSAWLLVARRMGDGTIVKTGLAAGLTYEFLALSKVGSLYGPPSLTRRVTVAGVASASVHGYSANMFPDRYDLYRPAVITSVTGEQTLLEPPSYLPTQTGLPCIFRPSTSGFGVGGGGFGMNMLGPSVEFDAKLLVPIDADLRPTKKGEQPDHVCIKSKMFIVLQIVDAAGRGMYKQALLGEREL